MMQMNGSKFDTLGQRQDMRVDQHRSGTKAQASTVVVLIDDDDTYREELALNLIECDFGVVEFGDGKSALDYFSAGQTSDIILLDWKMPSLNGAETLDRIRAMDIKVPVVILTASCDEKTEEAAFDHGAVDVLDKLRSPSILAKRLRIIAGGIKPASAKEPVAEVLSCGPLTLKVKTHRAFWRGEPVPLTVTEFRIVCLLASHAGEDVPYREIYDVVHGKEFKAGDGANGFHANVRSLIRHVRRKFRALDNGFGAIENYPGFGYRWLEGEPRRGEKAETRTSADHWSREAIA